MSLLTAADLNLFEPSAIGTNTSNAVFNINPYINDYINASGIINKSTYNSFFYLPSTTIYNTVVDPNSLNTLLSTPISSYSNGSLFNKPNLISPNMAQPANNQIYLQVTYANSKSLDINNIMININNLANAVPKSDATTGKYNTTAVTEYMGLLLKAIGDVTSSNIIGLANIPSTTSVLDKAMNDIQVQMNQLSGYMNQVNNVVDTRITNLLGKNNFYNNSNAIIDIASDLLPLGFTTPFYYNVNMATLNSLKLNVPSTNTNSNSTGESILAKKILIDLYLKAYTPLIHFNMLEAFKTHYVNSGDFINSRFALLAQVLLTFNVMNALVNTYTITDSNQINTLTNIFGILNAFISNYDGNDLRQVIINARIASMNATEYSLLMDNFQENVTATQLELKNIIELNKDIKKKFKIKAIGFWILLALLLTLLISCSVILGFFCGGDKKEKMIFTVYIIAGISAAIVILYEFLSVLINFVST